MAARLSGRIGEWRGLSKGENSTGYQLYPRTLNKSELADKSIFYMTRGLVEAGRTAAMGILLPLPSLRRLWPGKDRPMLTVLTRQRSRGLAVVVLDRSQASGQRRNQVPTKTCAINQEPVVTLPSGDMGNTVPRRRSRTSDLSMKAQDSIKTGSEAAKAQLPCGVSRVGKPNRNQLPRQGAGAFQPCSDVLQG